MSMFIRPSAPPPTTQREVRSLRDDPVLGALQTINDLERKSLYFGSIEEWKSRAVDRLTSGIDRPFEIRAETKTQARVRNGWDAEPGELGTVNWDVANHDNVSDYTPQKKKDNAEKKNPDGKKRNK